jgi:hypothetical protein
MPICEHCGGEIIFRYLGGVVTPIHIGGGSHCSGDSRSLVSRVRSLTYEHERDFCRPTRCPRCHLHVFFIRHNGGSVWVDALGWPWPKHPCFDSDLSTGLHLRMLILSSAALRSPTAGVVVRVQHIQGSGECYATVAQPDCKTEIWHVLHILDPASLLGALVVVSAPQLKLITVSGETFDICEPKFACPVCSQPVLSSLMLSHISAQHNAAQCSICGALVVKHLLQRHLYGHRRDNRRRNQVA